MKKPIVIALLIFTALSAHANTDDTISTGRYSAVPNAPSFEQTNPLRVIIKTKVPQAVKTVEGAITYLLMRSGYSLVNKASMSEKAQSLLALDLPQVHRSLGPMTLDVALRALSGNAFELIVDPVNRKISFELTTHLERLTQ